jgi:glycosyltransferase involved in cell wall biosynthesis
MMTSPVLQEERQQLHAGAAAPRPRPPAPDPGVSRVALVVLSGDLRRAYDAMAAWYPSADVLSVEKEELRGSDPMGMLRRLRRSAPDRFVFFTYSNAWQLGRLKMLVFGWLTGARRVLFMDLEGGVEEFGAARIWLREAPRAAVEYLLGLPLILASVVATWCLALGLGRGRRGVAGAAPAGKPGGLDVLFLRPTPSTGVVEGGESAHITGVLGGLRALGHRPRVLSNSRLPAVERAGHAMDVRPPGALFASHRLAFELWNNLVFTWHVWREARRSRPDVIYQRYSRNNWSGPVVSRLERIPLLLEWNGSEAWVGRHWSNLRWSWIIALYERVNRVAADAIIVVSRPRVAGLGAAGADRDRVVVNPNGADPDRFKPGAGGDAIRARYGLGHEVVVGFAGTFNHYQGAPVLLRAAADVCRRADVRFLIVGSGDELAAARDIAEREGIADRVVFTGHVPAEEVAAHIDACDVTAAPMIPNADGSEFFNSPVKVFEYMTAGKAIVASRLGQLTEVLEDGATGLLVEPGAPGPLADAIVRLAADPRLRARLAANARRVALERHTWRRNAERVVTAYEKAIGGPGTESRSAS